MANLKELYSEKVIKALEDWYMYSDDAIENAGKEAVEAAECLKFYEECDAWWVIETNPSLDEYPAKAVKEVENIVKRYGEPLNIREALEALLIYVSKNGTITEKTYYIICQIVAAMSACSHYLGEIDELGIENYSEKELENLLAVIEEVAKELDWEEDLDDVVSEDPVELLINERYRIANEEEDLKWWRKKSSLRMLDIFNRIPYGASYLIQIWMAKAIRLDKVRTRSLICLINEIKTSISKEETITSSMYKTIANIYKIVYLFRDLQKCKSWIKRFDNIKDAGEAIPYIRKPNDIGDKWASRLIRKPSLVKYINHMNSDNEDMALDEFIAIVAKKLHPELDTKAGILAIEYNLDADDEEDYIEFFRKYSPKKGSNLPCINVRSGVYALNKVAAGDPLAVFLGEATDCCQHPGGVGEDCVVDGWTKPSSDFYVLKKGDMVIAQSWAWVNGRTIVLDSIEGFKDFSNQVTALVKEFAKEAEKLGYEIRIGDTNYGLTQHVLKGIKHESVDPVKYEGYKGYTDAKKQVKLLV